MLTIWGETMDPAHVREEYPRPQMRRDSYLCLNGYWQYAFTPRSEGGFPAAYDGEIVVPFSPECELSGVGRTLLPGEYLWYRRQIVLPPAFCMGRLLLHFGAVDCECDVWCNDVHVGSHRGGYDPFTVELTDAVSADSLTIIVRVSDQTDAAFDARGKQKTKRGGIWYTPQSGIWQPVWLESVPQTYIRSLTITPDLDARAVRVTVHSETAATCRVSACGKEAEGASGSEIVLPVGDAALWSPESPVLHPLTVTMGEDRVESYFAMRKISVEKDASGLPRLMLNGEPTFHNGVLDQGYWSDGMYTAPSDEAMAYDIESMKALGFNMLRKHIKIEPLRWYYHCDRLGMLVWQDAVSGGGPYRTDVISFPVFTGIHRKDDAYRAFGRAEADSRERYRIELARTVETLYNCPCIVVWVPFNEGWGQFDAAKAVEQIRSMDSTRPIDPASGWHDQKCGDIRSYHVYFKPYRHVQDRYGRATALSEFGGYNLRVEGHAFNDRDFGYKRFPDRDALCAAVDRLYQKEILPAVPHGLCAAVYTQLSDVEDELNGLLTYDRRVLKLSALPVLSKLSHFFAAQ